MDPTVCPMTTTTTTTNKVGLHLPCIYCTCSREVTASSPAAQRLVILRKSWQVFHDRPLLLRSFCSFVLPVLDYCSAASCSAADSLLKLLDRVVMSAVFSSGGVVECKLAHPLQFCVRCGRSGVTPCIHFVLHSLCFSCWCGLHVVP